MAVSVSVTGVVRKHGRIYVRFDDGEEYEFQSRAEARDHCRSVMNDVAAKVLLKAMLIARGLRITADADALDDLDLIVGRTATFNRIAVNNVVRIT